MSNFIFDLIVGVLHQAVQQTDQFGNEWCRDSGPYLNAWRQLHWTIHDVETAFTTWQPPNERWLEYQRQAA
jgi:hypothetical protein